MAAMKGRRLRRPAATATIYARVNPDAHAKAHAAATALGISVAAYVEQLLARDEVGPDGRPVWWDRPPPLSPEEQFEKTA
jgi:hypothetical protein